MSLFDDYFNPAQFQAGGGLLGRLLSLRPDLDPSQPGAGDANPEGSFDAQGAAASQAPSQPVASQPSLGVDPVSSVVATQSLSSAQNPIISNNSLSPQSTNAGVSQATSSPKPVSGDRLSEKPGLPMTEVGYVEIPAASNPVLGELTCLQERRDDTVISGTTT
jgi:hypothetical protein